MELINSNLSATQHQYQPIEMLAALLKTQYKNEHTWAAEKTIGGEWHFDSIDFENRGFLKELLLNLDCSLFKELFVLYDPTFASYLALWYRERALRDAEVRSLQIPYISGNDFYKFCWEQQIEHRSGWYAFIPMSIIHCAEGWWEAEAFLKTQSTSD